MNAIENVVLRKVVDYACARLQERSTAAGAAAALVGGLHLVVNDPTMHALTDFISAGLGLLFVVIKTADGEISSAAPEPLPVYRPGSMTTGQLNTEEAARHGP